MSRLNRAFSHKEIALILFLTLVLLGMVYYRLLYVPMQEEIRSYDTTQLDMEIQVEQARAAQISRMKQEIESGLKNYNGVIVPYDNQEGELNALYLIFKSAESFHITARQPVATGNAVRREMQLSFTMTSYEAAEQVIDRVTNCEYRCLVGNLSITPVSNTGVKEGWVNCSMSVTFFETLVGAETQDGLQIKESS